MNKVILMGRLVKDPEIKQTQSGVAVARFSIAVNREFKNQQGEYEADFIDCEAWRGTAEFVGRYFSKGSMIAVEGSMRNNNYEKDGIKHYGIKVVIDHAHFCGGKNENGSGQQNTQNGAYNGNNGGYNGRNNGYQQQGGNNGFSAPAPQNAGFNGNNCFNGGFNNQPVSNGYQQGAPNAGYNSSNGGQQMPLNGNPMGYPQYNTAQQPAQNAPQPNQQQVNDFANALQDGEVPF